MVEELIILLAYHAIKKNANEKIAKFRGFSKITPPEKFINLLKIAPIDRSRSGLHKTGLRLILSYFQSGVRSTQSRILGDPKANLFYLDGEIYIYIYIYIYLSGHISRDHAKLLRFSTLREDISPPKLARDKNNTSFVQLSPRSVDWCYF